MNLVLIISVLLGIILFIILFSKLKIKIYKRGSGKLELDIYFLFFAHINLNLTRIFDKYLKTHSTKENINTDAEFEYISDSISHALCKHNNNVFLFRVDLDGNLFYCDFNKKEDYF